MLEGPKSKVSFIPKDITYTSSDDDFTAVSTYTGTMEADDDEGTNHVRFTN